MALRTRLTHPRSVLSIGESGVASGKIRVEIDGLLKVLLCESIIVRAEFAQMP